MCEGPLDKAEGVGLGPAHVARKAGTKAVEYVIIDVHKLEGASLDVKATPTPTKSTTSVELAGRAVKATTVKPEALKLWAESKAWCGLETPLLPPSQKDLGKLGTLL